jgi:hypothetical protein
MGAPLSLAVIVMGLVMLSQGIESHNNLLLYGAAIQVALGIARLIFNPGRYGTRQSEVGLKGGD